MDKMTPMMEQYFEVKKSVEDALVFYRLGDFYELFFEDAEVASKALDLVLTARSIGNNQKAPMCGVPFHAASSYIQKLINQGFKIAIVEQLEDPKSAKGIVKRGVIQVVTPGTTFNLEEKSTTVIAALNGDLIQYNLVLCDITSGRLSSLHVAHDPATLLQTLNQYAIAELLVSPDLDPSLRNEIEEKTMTMLTIASDDHVSAMSRQYLKGKFSELTLQGGRILLNYLQATQHRELSHLQPLVEAQQRDFMQMDYSTELNLELIQSQRNNSKKATLFSYLDRCQTAMGSRLLRDWITHPLIQETQIVERQQQITFLMNETLVNLEIQESLKRCFDIEKILAKLSFGTMNPQDVLRLRTTLGYVPAIQSALAVSQFQFFQAIDAHKELYQDLLAAFKEEVPLNVRDANVFNDGISAELDEYRGLLKTGKNWLLNYEQEQREKTGIKTLKVGYNRAFGYYIEISKGALSQLNGDYGYIRKQTLTTGERFISEALQSWETKINEATEQVVRIEEALFQTYLGRIEQARQSLTQLARALAQIDVLWALSAVCSQHGYVCPKFNDEQHLAIIDARHPILEDSLNRSQYIANSIVMEPQDQVYILTGPNMGGKSTYMRMIALLVVMAQIGCFVPAASAELPIFDAIFTRMGASDDILMGQSTFMVEMNEAQQALAKATVNSLILFDEIGRGTSTYDGMALAQAILEYISTIIHAKTIFSTHYHELTAMSDANPSIRNIHVDVYEENQSVTFLYKVVAGKADRSYGVNVARLAHLPQSVIDRARDLLAMFETNKHNINVNQAIVKMNVEPAGFVEARQILNTVDINKTTPLQALSLLETLKETINKE